MALIVRFTISLLALAVLVASVEAQTAAPTLIGAKEVLKGMAAPRGVPDIMDASEIKKAGEEYWSQVGSMTPPQAAQAWLKLCDQALKSKQMVSSAETDYLISDLPSPKSWPFIKSDLKKRMTKKKSVFDASTLVLMDALTNDQSNVWTDFSDLKKRMALVKGPNTKATDSYFNGDDTPQLWEPYIGLAEQFKDKARLLEGLEKLKAFYPKSEERRYRSEIKLPALVEILGHDKAAEVLKDFLVNCQAQLSFRDHQTAALAREVATQNIDQLQTPQFSLCENTSEGADLYIAMDKRWHLLDNDKGTTAEDSYDENASPATNCVVGLAARGDIDQALQMANHKVKLELDYSYPVSVLSNTAHLDEFFYRLVQAKPSYVGGDSISLVALQNGHLDRLEPIARAEAANPTEDKENRCKAAFLVMQYLLLQDKPEEAAKYAMSVLPELGSSTSQMSGMGERLLDLGVYYKRTDWQDAAIKYTTKSYDSDWEVDDLVEAGRYPEAEKAALAGYSSQSSSDQGSISFLTKLIEIYDAAGRYQDVVDLMDKAPTWGFSDLSSVRRINCGCSGNKLLLRMARALLKTGHKQEGMKVLRDYIMFNLTDDEGYQLLLDTIGPEAMIAEMDEAAKWDRFEERPLVWKAVALFKQSRLDQAESTARAAIAIDPSDGDQPKGRRMYAYSVLADILEAEQKHPEADSNRAIIKAIRMSEDGDEMAKLGMTRQAQALYSQSLSFFDNAYCIHARLAINLASEGNFKDAAIHYQKAFELMPKSFGLVATHCFNCERAFNGDEVQKIAEQVLDKAVTAEPNNPKILYLRGYLRQEEGRYADALQDYVAATNLEPDYADAWDQITYLQGKYPLPSAEFETARLNLIRLGRNVSMWDQPALIDWAAYYNAAATATAPQGASSNLYPLKGSIAGTYWNGGGSELDLNNVRPPMWRQNPGLLFLADTDSSTITGLLSTGLFYDSQGPHPRGDVIRR